MQKKVRLSHEVFGTFTSHMKCALSVFIVCSSGISPKAIASASPLLIKDVIELIRTKSLYQKDLQFGYQRSEVPLLLAESNFDSQIYFKGQNEDSRAEAPGALSNDRDRSLSLGMGISKKFSTGSTLGLDYSYLHKDSELSALMKSLGSSPIQYYHSATLNFKQELWNNAFGLRDNVQTEVAHLQRTRAQFEKDEATEDLVLQGIKLYLDAYFAQENLKQALAARDKYLQLLKSIQQKNQMGFDDRSELIKTKAELQNQERTVKSATLTHWTLNQKLMAFLNLDTTAEATFPLEIPNPLSEPTLKERDLKTGGTPETQIPSLRKIQSLDLLIQATQAEKESAANSEKPQLNFFSQAAFSGVDPTSSSAANEVTHLENPKYTVGLEFMMRWGSLAQKADGLNKTLAHEEARNNQLKVQRDLTETLERTQRNVQAKHIVAVNAQEAIQLWESAMKSQEKNHRFGRITTAELLMDYGSYFRAKSTLSGAIADYQYSLYEYQAARDELIPSQSQR